MGQIYSLHRPTKVTYGSPMSELKSPHLNEYNCIQTSALLWLERGKASEKNLKYFREIKLNSYSTEECFYRKIPHRNK